jgi:NAD(P)-dependent dehydrogenase (short-subunit alcohol dehydrogenase family)
VSQSPSLPSIIIFGASGGIGSALTRQLATQGCYLCLVARDQGRLDSLAGELHAEAFSLDATDSTAVERCLEEVSQKHGRVDGVVNCAGSLLLKPAHLTTDSEWAAVLGVNLTSAFQILRSASARMVKTGGGSIVLMSSAVARRGMINHEAIAAAKAGVAGLALSAAATYPLRNFKTNVTSMKAAIRSIIHVALALILVSCGQSPRNPHTPAGQEFTPLDFKEVSRVSENDLAMLTGDWEGDLQYLDFGDDKTISTIKLKIRMTYALAVRTLSISLEFTEPGGNLVQDETSLQVVAEGRQMLFDQGEWVVTSNAVQTLQGNLSLVFERDGLDNNKQARLKNTIKLTNGKAFTFAREVRSAEQEAFFTRSRYRLTRIGE